MTCVVLTGCAGPLGRRVAARLAAGGAFDEVRGIDRVVVPPPSGCSARQVDLLVEPDLAACFDGATTVVHLASVFGVDRPSAEPSDEAQLAVRVVDAALAAGARSIVLLSSATVYGAWPDNPIPLTEEAPLRPNVGFAFVDGKAAVEDLAARVSAEHPEVSVAVLRPTTALAHDATSWVSRALAAAANLRIGAVDPPVQFVHFDDLAEATALVAEHGARGPFNVAPDGWIPPDAMRALSGVPRPRVPLGVARKVASLRWHLGVSPTPPTVLPWAMHPWVVANDRLRAEGWVPSHTNEEAYVAGTAPGPLDTLSPKRRQELALGAVGAAAAVAAAGALVVYRRMRHRS